MAVQEQISIEKNQARIGREFKVIVDRFEGDNAIGRTEYDSPEVDDEVIFPCTRRGVRIGDFVRVRVTDALENDLLAEMVD